MKIQFTLLVSFLKLYFLTLVPQLDFFTFPHQYIIASICFCGMYYFNLLFFFPKIKKFQLNKIFSLESILANHMIINSYYWAMVEDLFSFEIFIFNKFSDKNLKLQKKIFFKKGLKKRKLIRRISSKQEKLTAINIDKILMYTILSFLFLFLFFKNFLIFNAEKLMLIYFLVIVFCLSIFLSNFLSNFLKNDISKFLEIVVSIEENSNKIIFLLKNYLFKLKFNSVLNNIEFLLLKNLEIKLVKKIK